MGTWSLMEGVWKTVTNRSVPTVFLSRVVSKSWLEPVTGRGSEGTEQLQRPEGPRTQIQGIYPNHIPLTTKTNML